MANNDNRTQGQETNQRDGFLEDAVASPAVVTKGSTDTLSSGGADPAEGNESYKGNEEEDHTTREPITPLSNQLGPNGPFMPSGSPLKGSRRSSQASRSRRSRRAASSRTSQLSTPTCVLGMTLGGGSNVKSRPPPAGMKVPSSSQNRVRQLQPLKRTSPPKQ